MQIKGKQRKEKKRKEKKRKEKKKTETGRWWSYLHLLVSSSRQPPVYFLFINVKVNIKWRRVQRTEAVQRLVAPTWNHFKNFLMSIAHP
ncbi:uncharacterized protein LOC127163502 isoform X1 [Labeo rohita]|uniref:uncharacterized protein LOC127163502 isoform X1 n=1 Tax=Labeo rohita TaxID=84645 RepID=UPI0021E2F160|nr:uncharacterized protein LOC127163502 isoform X1 [Labeo rohita]